jgi:hypothetical protein
MKIKLTLAAFAALAMSASAANVLTNGSFENPSYPVGGGAVAISPGWNGATLSGGSNYFSVATGNTGISLLFNGTVGTQYGGVQNVGDAVTLFSTDFTLAAAGNYTASFDYFGREVVGTNDGQSFRVLMDGIQIGGVTPVTIGNGGSFSFATPTAIAAGTHTFGIEFTTPSPSADNSLLLDNVNVDFVPEASTALLGGLSVLGLALRRRRA